MQSVRSRLSIGYLLVLIIGMGLAAGLAWISVEALYLSTQRENLLAQAKLTAAALQGQPFPLQSAGPYSQTANTLPGIHTHILAEQGAVVFNLPMLANTDPVQAPAVENTSIITQAELLQRSEIQQALLGRPATAIRVVNAAGDRRVLYAAAPILGLNGSPIGIVYLASPLPAGGLPANILLQLAGALVIAILLASFAGALLARSIARPIELVARAAHSVTAGNLNEKVPVDKNISELNGLSQAFNAMTSSLRQSEIAKNAFISDVTHELRTPLTVIKGTLETLEDGAIDDLAGRGALLTSMQSETERLIRLVNDLLVLTRADAGTLKLNIQNLDLGELARSRCEHFSALTGPRKISMNVLGGDSFRINVLADRDRVIQVLDNLLDNAVRYSPSGSIITVEISGQNTDGQCTIRDSGPGISEKHLPLIFERFYRADASRDRHTGGAGLGLAIVRSLLLAQGGRISAQSKEGAGTVISFWLPLSTDCHPTA
jgi:signal transduction histidine kinase